MTETGEAREKRRHQRLELEVEVLVRTDTALLPGTTQDVSESGISAILPLQLHEGEEVELQIKLPRATTTTRAVVRHRNVFRHGFEFLQPLPGILGTALYPSAETQNLDPHANPAETCRLSD